MYKKSYTGFALWLILYLLMGIVPAFVLPELNAASYTRLLMNLTTIAMAILTFIIWRTEYVYWYNGISYEDAEKAGSERRRKYGYLHFQLFLKTALAGLVYTAVSVLAGFPWWLDLPVFGIGLIAAAFWTMKYKL
ncbi:MAG: hypothetical protein IKK75_13265 [Clostridia bacterium]|nr:hypothetical protein [Clostridia bacterium]